MPVVDYYRKLGKVVDVSCVSRLLSIQHLRLTLSESPLLIPDRLGQDDRGSDGRHRERDQAGPALRALPVSSLPSLCLPALGVPLVVLRFLWPLHPFHPFTSHGPCEELSNRRFFDMSRSRTPK